MTQPEDPAPPAGPARGPGDAGGIDRDEVRRRAVTGSGLLALRGAGTQVISFAGFLVLSVLLSPSEIGQLAFGLGIAVVSVSIAVLTGARDEETGMISGLNSTGHEIGGTLGIAIFSTIAAGSGALAGPQAASGIAHAFVASGLLATVASLVALAVLPRARHFVPKLRVSPSAMPSH